MTEFRLAVPAPAGTEVGARIDGPTPATRLLVLGHGAGAGMRHPFMDGLTERLAALGTTVLRYQFPYMERGAKRPDRQPVLRATVAAAIRAAHERASGARVWAGGKSMGGRMTSLAASAGELAPVRGVVFVGFPLHAAGRPGEERAEHLAAVDVPMLFLQGTRDALAELPRIVRVCASLGTRAELHVVPDADHGFHVRLRETGKRDADVLDELASVIDARMQRDAAATA